ADRHLGLALARPAVDSLDLRRRRFRARPQRESAARTAAAGGAGSLGPRLVRPLPGDELHPRRDVLIVRPPRRPLTVLLSVLGHIVCDPAARGAPTAAPPTTLSASATPPAIDSSPTVNGLYPLWEHTGEIHPWLHFQIGYSHAQLGLGWVQLGT